jgi:hypothetical protein
MRRALIAAALLAVAAAVFFVVRGAGADPLHLTTSGARYTATVEIAEPSTGSVTVKVQVDKGEADTVTVSTVMPAMGHATPEIAAREAEPGQFVAEGRLFPMSGLWEVWIRLDGPAGEEELAVNVPISG